MHMKIKYMKSINYWWLDSSFYTALTKRWWSVQLQGTRTDLLKHYNTFPHVKAGDSIQWLRAGFGETRWPDASDGGVLTALKVTPATDGGVTVTTDEAVTMDTDERALPVPLR